MNDQSDCSMEPTELDYIVKCPLWMRPSSLTYSILRRELNDNVTLILNNEIGSRGLRPGAYRPPNVAGLPVLVHVPFT